MPEDDLPGAACELFVYCGLEFSRTRSTYATAGILTRLISSLSRNCGGEEGIHLLHGPRSIEHELDDDGVLGRVLNGWGRGEWSSFVAASLGL